MLNSQLGSHFNAANFLCFGKFSFHLRTPTFGTSRRSRISGNGRISQTTDKGLKLLSLSLSLLSFRRTLKTLNLFANKKRVFRELEFSSFTISPTESPRKMIFVQRSHLRFLSCERTLFHTHSHAGVYAHFQTNDPCKKEHKSYVLYKK